MSVQAPAGAAEVQAAVEAVEAARAPVPLQARAAEVAAPAPVQAALLRTTLSLAGSESCRPDKSNED